MNAARIELSRRQRLAWDRLPIAVGFASLFAGTKAACRRRGEQAG